MPAQSAETISDPKFWCPETVLTIGCKGSDFAKKSVRIPSHSHPRIGDIGPTGVRYRLWRVSASRIRWGKQGDSESLKALHRATKLGANFIDAAQVHGDGRSEAIIARFRKEWKGIFKPHVTPVTGRPAGRNYYY
ncbi:MAG TPA: aldo/keto reductase [Fibrobacteria bacterium]|nr:aldo/keto reductase [Fibrobacteria bacterium]